MRVLDASAIIYAWDNYPEPQFPGLWAWLAHEVKTHELTIPTVAFDEVAHIAPDCASWLKVAEVLKLPMTETVLMTAMTIKNAIGVVNDKYHPNGVGENDLLIIATAKVHGAELITNENRQFGAQKVPSKRKIPAVCDMPDVSVSNMNFLEYIQKSQEVF